MKHHRPNPLSMWRLLPVAAIGAFAIATQAGAASAPATLHATLAASRSEAPLPLPVPDSIPLLKTIKYTTPDTKLLNIPLTENGIPGSNSKTDSSLAGVTGLVGALP